MSSREDVAIGPGTARGYFRIMQRALGALDEILHEDRPGPWGNRPNKIINAVAMSHLARLRRNFVAWDMKHMFADGLRLDSVESGFPLYRNVMDLERESARISERIAEFPDPGTIRREMLDLVLKFKQHPEPLQKTMAERLYLETLGDGPVFPAFHPPETIRAFNDKRSGRLHYVVHWAAYDGVENLPLVYLAVLEDSVSGPARGDTIRSVMEHFGDRQMGDMPGIPNAGLSDAFQTFCANHSQYGLNLTSIATAMDGDFPICIPSRSAASCSGPSTVPDRPGIRTRCRRCSTAPRCPSAAGS